ncbi:DUF3048 domain-containing protein [Alkaliphilus sp. B6464]|uniref:DUF3048 domain-containing protein n=1 Tax=Alkaliphilus sp. B6464 TaxID=2731219 RepID=UPI001BAAA468|nr:DUF3048 domain-containing protein [Alkaliphilus sp. B6464]QUH21041.1 DUF3048 domain-containing protein [Alkaliphilus sp. B6464]
MDNWRKRAIIIFLVSSILLNGVGCSKKGNDEQNNVTIETEQNEEAEEISQPEIEGAVSPLSGLHAPEEKINRRPLAIIFDNQSGARPQAGLIDAEVAYEFLAEGNITRYLGIFLVNEPEIIGSIRSARPYFIEKALEFDSYFVHVGGSDQALADIKSKKVADIDAMSRGNDVFWRKNHKKMPHNMYSSYDALKKAAEKSNYRAEPQFDGFKFNSELKVMDMGEIAQEIKIKYSKGHEPSYIYDDENKVYNRYYNGIEHKDETTKETLTATNIIIQEVAAKVIDDKLRLDMNTVGEGRGKYITTGKTIDITWKKGSYEGATKYYDGTGQELSLNPGKTWIQVVRNFDNVTIAE